MTAFVCALALSFLLVGVQALTNNAVPSQDNRHLDQEDIESTSTVHPLLNKVQPFGFQSTKSLGHDIASSIIPSPNAKQGFFLSGTTTGFALSPDAETALHIGMHCYVMQVKPFEDDWVWVKKVGAYRNGFATGTTCTSIHSMPYKKDGSDESTRVVVTGYTEGNEIFNPEDGILPFSKVEADQETEAMETNKVNGFVIVLDVPNSLAERKTLNSSEIKLVAGKMLTGRKVQYPVTIAPVGHNSLVVASLVTDDGSLNLQAKLQQGLGEVGDFEPVYKYGNYFNVRIEKLVISDADVLTRNWSKTFSTNNGRGAHVTSLAYDEFADVVLFAGTTHGRGEAFGKFNPIQSNGNDYDGYVTKLDAKSGEIKTENGQALSARIETNPGKDEFINALCTHGRALYIVGSTNSIIDPTFGNSERTSIDSSMKMNAFIQKRQIGSLRVLWTRQIGTMNITGDSERDYQDVEGLGCAIAHDEDIVYLSGTVTAGASVVDGKPGTGEKDVFVQAFKSTPGTPSERFPLTQIGSQSDDFLAKDGGGLTIDQYGNAVLYGTTRGSLVSKKEMRDSRFATAYSDVFLMSFLVDEAEHVPQIEQFDSKPLFIAVGRSKSKTRVSIEIAAISIFASAGVIILFLFAYHYGKTRTVNEIETQQDQDIARYLEEFEDGKRSVIVSSGNNDDGQLYDISSYYGQNFAVGKDNDGSDDPHHPGEVSFSLGENKNPPAGGGETSAENKTTYDDLMKSYKSIQKDLSGDAPSAPSNQFVIENPNSDIDHKVI